MKKRVFIADDDEHLLDALRLILEEAEYIVETSRTGKELIGRKKLLPDIVLLDVGMGKHDGSKLCKQLKHQLYTQHIPVILVSGHHDLPQVVIECNADGMVAKPFALTAILDTVAEYLVK